MPAQTHRRILPMTTSGTQHLIDRTYRESGQFQWVRETYQNAIEASATRIEFGIEWQGVELGGVYRRTIADDGRGMTPEELVTFFNTFGGGGKPIGGLHDNFGVGAKTSLLPWNRAGIVVVSWVDGEASMIWVQQDIETGEYGLRLFEAVDPATGDIGLDEVVAPFEDEEIGLDWSAIKPDWIDDHGTVMVLLGNDPIDDTVLGDPSRAEADIKGISTYLNRRYWEIDDGVSVVVDELRTTDRNKWPRSAAEAHGSQPKSGVDRRTNPRTIRGAKHYICYPHSTFAKGKLGATGTVEIDGGVAVDWYLWEGDRPAVQSYASISGFIGTLYDNELYDVVSHHSTYRSFGITEQSVRSRVWLIVRPPHADEHGRVGVYPRTDRNGLLLRGGPHAGGPLPLADWAAAFADDMPDAILEAIKESRAGDDGELDESWRERLADRFGSRWRIPKLRARPKGKHTVDPVQPSTVPRKVVARRQRKEDSPGGGSGARGGTPGLGSSPGTEPAERVKVAGGLPRYRSVRANEVNEGMMAAWQPNDPTALEGVVLINVEHPVLAAEIEFWQSQYADHFAEEIQQDVIDAYGQIAVSKVAHSEHLKGIIPSHIVDKQLRSDEALTMSLLGLIAEEAVIAPRIGGKYRKRRGEG